MGPKMTKKPSYQWRSFRHAGLFSDTHDMAVLMQVMLNGGGYGNVKLFDDKTVAQFTSPLARRRYLGLVAR